MNISSSFQAGPITFDSWPDLPEEDDEDSEFSDQTEEQLLQAMMEEEGSDSDCDSDVVQQTEQELQDEVVQGQHGTESSPAK